MLTKFKDDEMTKPFKLVFEFIFKLVFLSFFSTIIFCFVPKSQLPPPSGNSSDGKSKTDAKSTKDGTTKTEETNKTVKERFTDVFSCFKCKFHLIL